MAGVDEAADVADADSTPRNAARGTGEAVLEPGEEQRLGRRGSSGHGAPTFGSLFAGIGGIDLGLERAGWTGRWQVEYEPFCQRVLAKHWPDVPRLGDVHDVHGAGACPVADAEHAGPPRPGSGTQPPSALDGALDGGAEARLCPNCLPYVDLIAGGFPCQPFSNAGKRRGKDDERWLWPEFARLVGELRPRYVLVENVPGLLAGHGGMGAVLGDLAALGYDAEWDSIPASAVGAPHLRYRVWIVAHRQADAPRADADGVGPHREDLDIFRGAELRDEQVGEPGSLGAALADADGWGREGERVGWLFDRVGSSLRHDADGRGGEALADASGHRLGAAGPRDRDDGDAGIRSEPELADTDGDHAQGILAGVADQAVGGGSVERQAGSRGDGLRWWATEPDVGRVAARLSAGLDELGGRVDAHPECIAQGRAAGLPRTERLRVLWQHIDATEAPSEPGRCALCGHPLSALPCRGACSPWYLGAGIKEAEDLRCVREGVLGLLPHEGQDVLAALSGRGWSPERTQAVGRRTDRLRSLGNAVVPQVVEFIGRRILEAEALT